MAKLAANSTKISKMLKGKKRKHVPSQQEDDEIAAKSLIVEPEEQQAEIQVDYGKTAKKRKSETKNRIKEKRSKHSNSGEDQLSENEFNDENDNDMDELTSEQLVESKHIESSISILTVRQKKKEKHEKRLETQKDQSVEKEKQRNEQYLNKWKSSRGEWKFEKLRQISIQQHMFDEQYLSNDVWPVALEYLSGSKGAAKDKIKKLADEVVEQLDKECSEKTDNSEQQLIINSIKYQRARDLLQNLD